jgi:hypothetical protein
MERRDNDFQGPFPAWIPEADEVSRIVLPPGEDEKNHAKMRWTGAKKQISDFGFRISD